MGCFSFNRLSKNFRLSIASSVDYSRSNPSESLSSFGVYITFFQGWILFSLHASTADSLKSTFLTSFLETERRAFTTFTRVFCFFLGRLRSLAKDSAFFAIFIFPSTLLKKVVMVITVPHFWFQPDVV